MHPARPPNKNRSKSLKGLSLVPVMGDDIRVAAHLILERGNLRVFDNDKGINIMFFTHVDLANLGKLKETFGKVGCNLSFRSLTAELKSKSLVFNNTELDESVKFLTESQSSLCHKALKVYMSSFGEEFPNKLDFINLLSKELSVRKLDCEVLIDDLVNNGWLMYFFGFIINELRFENETLTPGPRTVIELDLIENIQ